MYLRQIRNVVVAGFVIWIAGALIGGIVWLVAVNNAHTAQAKARCQNNGGVWVNGQCL